VELKCVDESVIKVKCNAVSYLIFGCVYVLRGNRPTGNFKNKIWIMSENVTKCWFRFIL